MPRAVYTYEGTWLDREYRKDLKALPPADQQRHLEELAAFMEAVAEAAHPISDPHIRQAYRPEGYGGIVKLKTGSLVEYRLGRRTRVIAKYPAHPGEDSILLVAITITHDHERLKELIRRNRGELDDF